MSSCDKAYNAEKQIHTRGHVTIIFLLIHLNNVSDLSVLKMKYGEMFSLSESQGEMLNGSNTNQSC